MKFAPTAFAARQFVNHGHVRVNGKRVNISSYLVKDGDTIEVREKSQQLADRAEGDASRASATCPIISRSTTSR